jgi:PHD/YefM family antitoxin component YafN of YafNO toxin-antitoxin module
MKFLSTSKARSRLPDLLGSLERVALTKNGEPLAVLLHIDDFRALTTMQRLAADPYRFASLLRDHQHVQEGQVAGFPELEEGWEGRLGELVRYPSPGDWAEHLEVAEVHEQSVGYRSGSESPAGESVGSSEGIRDAFDRLVEDTVRLGRELKRAQKTNTVDDEDESTAGG